MKPTSLPLVAGISVLLTAGLTVPAVAAEPGPAPSSQPTPRSLHGDPARLRPGLVEPVTVTPRVDDATLSLMARSSGRTLTAQRAHLTNQATQNNTYAALFAAGHRYDGAYFDAGNRLVLQADPASPSGRAAVAKGLTVRKAAHGEARLNTVADALQAVASERGIVSISPDVPRDRVVVTVTDFLEPSTRRRLAAYGPVVTVEKGQPLRTNTTVYGGDKISMAGGGYCSAGFPAHTSAGERIMLWVGHCVENQQTFYKGYTQVGTFGDSEFISYDGLPDYDMGGIWMGSGHTMSTTLNKYGTYGRITDATRGAWKAPVGTDLCKSGATSGVTCGQIRSYNNSVTYSDAYGRTVASVRGLAETSVCTAPGDSGGAFTSGGYAVGMTSGGPSNQRCTFNGGYQSGKRSYITPVSDALSYYGLIYG